jgi:hypothetical protein
MRQLFSYFLIFITCSTLWAQQPVSAPSSTELYYDWQPNKTYRFRVVSTDQFTTSAMGMNLKDQYRTDLDFGIYVVSVDATGTASVQLYITNYLVRNAASAVVADLRSISPRLLFVPCTVDRLGHFDFDKKLMLITASGGPVLSMESDSIAQMLPDIEKPRWVQAHAEFLSSGMLKTEYVPEKLGSARRIQIKENEKTKKIPVFPYDCLSAMAMPEGPVKTKDVLNMQSGFYETTVRVNSIDAQWANLELTMLTDTSNDMFEGKITAVSGDGKQQFGSSNNPAGSGLPGAPPVVSNPAKPFESQMRLSGDDRQMFDMMRGSMPVLVVRLKTQFDHVNHMFQRVGGTVITEMLMPGFSMKINSDVQFARMP